MTAAAAGLVLQLKGIEGVSEQRHRFGVVGMIFRPAHAWIVHLQAAFGLADKRHSASLFVVHSDAVIARVLGREITCYADAVVCAYTETE